MNETHRNKQGFTLIEILVVATIIGIMLVVGLAAYTTAQKKGRDARRKGDIKAARNALEQYNSDYEAYPEESTCADLGGELETQGFLDGGIPTDPKINDDDYQYSCDSNSDEYCVCAKLESGGGNANAPDASGCNWSQGGDFFCVSNLQ